MKNTLASGSRHRSAKSAKGLYICIAIIAALSVALAGLSVFTAIRVSRSQEQTQAVTRLEEDLAKAQADLEAATAALQEKEKAAAELQAASDKQKAEIDEQKSEIETLKATVSSLTQQVEELKDAAKAGGIPVPAIDPKTKMVALTFDDGPGPDTPRLLDALKERGVKVTFFMTGNSINKYPNTVKRVFAEGHEIGNHSVSHKNLKPLDAQGVFKELNPCSDRIEQLTGKRPTLIRCPYGNKNDHVVAYAKKERVPLIYWSVDTQDWRVQKEPNPTELILKETFEGKWPVRDGGIILMHDSHKTSVDAAIPMVDRLLKEGYRLVTVTELLQSRYGKITPGETYTNAPRPR